jgi:hypothetical protein
MTGICRIRQGGGSGGGACPTSAELMELQTATQTINAYEALTSEAKKTAIYNALAELVTPEQFGDAYNAIVSITDKLEKYFYIGDHVFVQAVCTIVTADEVQGTTPPAEQNLNYVFFDPSNSYNYDNLKFDISGPTRTVTDAQLPFALLKNEIISVSYTKINPAAEAKVSLRAKFEHKDIEITAGSYEPETINWETRAVTVGSSIKIAVNNWVKSQKDRGLFSEYSFCYFLNSETIAQAKQDIIRPVSSIWVNNPNHVPFEYTAGDGIGKYVRSQFTPGGDAIFSLNNASVGLWSEESAVASNVPLNAIQSPGNYIYLHPRTSANNFETLLHSGLAFLRSSNFDGSGFYQITRPDSTKVVGYKNGLQSGERLLDSTVMPALELWLFVTNQSGAPINYSNAKISMFWGGSKVLGERADEVFADFSTLRNTIRNLI